MTTSSSPNARQDRAQPGGRADAEPRLVGRRYLLAAPIGHGAMGVVWRARDELLDRNVAVKEVRLPPSLSEAERGNGYQRTLREARTAARLSHPAVAAVYDVVEEFGRPWIVMELVPGRSLDEVIAQDGPLPPSRAAELGHQLLAALASAHAVGVLHRDVKPSNVILTPDGRTVLTDFGIATIEGDPSLTQTGIVMGSPGFLAPERIRGGAATPASDLWSLGATVYAAVEGCGPYDCRGGAMTTMAAVVAEDPLPPTAAGPLAAVISALLSRDPARRPSATAAARMLKVGAAATGIGSTVPVIPGDACHGPGGTLPVAQTVRRAVSVPPGSPAAAPSAAPARPNPPRRRRRIITFVIIVAIFIASALAAAQIHKARSTASTGLQAGFRWYSQPAGVAGMGTAGFRVAVPDSWRATRNGMKTVIAEPSRSRFLELDLTPHRYAGMAGEVLWLQRQTLRSATFPGYHRYYIRPVPYQGTIAVDWAFSWRSRSSGQVSVLDRVLIARGPGTSQSFALSWSTPARQWQVSMPTLREALATFQPVW